MSLLTNISNSLKRLFSSRRNSSLIVGGPEVYVDINTSKAITEGYLGNTAVYSIVNKDAEKFASIPRYVVSNNEDRDRIENDLSKLLDKPNEYQSQDAFFGLARTYRLLTGECFIWLNRGDTAMLTETGDLVELPDETHKKKPVMEMYVLPSDHVSIIPDTTNLWGVLGYMLDADGQKIPLRKVDVIHWKNQNLNFSAGTREHLRGISPLSPGYKTLTEHNSATNASVRMVQNDGSKGLLFNETLDGLTPEQQKQIDGVVSRKINGNDVKGAVAMMQGKWGYLNIMGSIDKMVFEAKTISWQEMCFLFGVPVELFDPKTTFANKEQAQKGWVSNTIVPACKQFDGELGRALLISFGLEKAALIESDFDELPEMQEDLAAKAAWLMTTWPLTPNEVREALGYEARSEPEFDEPWVPNTASPISKMDDGFDDMANELAKQGI